MQSRSTTSPSPPGALARNLGLRNRVRCISPGEFWDAVPAVQYHMDEPMADAAAVALYFLNREAARDVKVVLSGEGADELFGRVQTSTATPSLRGGITACRPGCGAGWGPPPACCRPGRG